MCHTLTHYIDLINGINYHNVIEKGGRGREWNGDAHAIDLTHIHI
jgi:hypothetical protein